MAQGITVIQIPCRFPDARYLVRESRKKSVRNVENASKSLKGKVARVVTI